MNDKLFDEVHKLIYADISEMDDLYSNENSSGLTIRQQQEARDRQDIERKQEEGNMKEEQERKERLEKQERRKTLEEKLLSLDPLSSVKNVSQNKEVQENQELHVMWPETSESNNLQSWGLFPAELGIPLVQTGHGVQESQTGLSETPGLYSFLTLDLLQAESNISQDEDTQNMYELQRLQKEQIGMEVQDIRELEDEISGQTSLNVVNNTETPAGSSAAHAALQNSTSEENETDILAADTEIENGNSEKDKTTLLATHPKIQDDGSKKENIKLKCDICEATFAYKHSLARHKSIVHKVGKALFACAECGRRFQTTKLLESHTQNCHQISSDRLKCDLCEATFTHRYGLILHKSILHNMGKSNLTCAECGRQFQTENLLERHIQALHRAGPQEKIWQCTKCSIFYRWKMTLQNHMRVVHGEKSGKFRCEECHQEFYNRAGLQEHIGAIHQNVRHTCSVCGKSYNYRRDLAKHRKMKDH